MARRGGGQSRPLCASAGPLLDRDHQHRQQREQQRQHCRRRPIERAPVGREDRSREGVDAQDGDSAKVTEDVQRNQQSAATNCRPNLREGGTQERGDCPQSKRPGYLFVRGIDAAQGSSGWQDHVGQSHRGEDQPRCPEPREAGEHRRPSEGAHKARDSERKNDEDDPEPPQFDRRPDDEPRNWNADPDCGECHEERQRQRRPSSLPNRGLREDRLCRSGTTLDRSNREVDHRHTHHHGHYPCKQEEQPWGACDQISPTERSIACVPGRSLRSLSLTGGLCRLDSGGDPLGPGMPGSSGYSKVSVAK